MQVYIVKLQLLQLDNGTYSSDFIFKKSTSDKYIELENTFELTKGFYKDVIYKIQEIKNLGCGYEITQGFSHELTEEEQKEVEKQMKELMLLQLNKDITDIENKIKCLQNIN